MQQSVSDAIQIGFSSRVEQNALIGQLSSAEKRECGMVYETAGRLGAATAAAGRFR